MQDRPTAASSTHVSGASTSEGINRHILSHSATPCQPRCLCVAQGSYYRALSAPGSGMLMCDEGGAPHSELIFPGWQSAWHVASFSLEFDMRFSTTVSHRTMPNQQSCTLGSPLCCRLYFHLACCSLLSCWSEHIEGSPFVAQAPAMVSPVMMMPTVQPPAERIGMYVLLPWKCQIHS